MNTKTDNSCADHRPWSEKQGQYLAYLWTYRLINGQAPAEKDMQNFFGVSAPSVHQMVLNLERAGLIARQPGTARSIKLLVEHQLLPTLQPPANRS